MSGTAAFMIDAEEEYQIINLRSQELASKRSKGNSAQRQRQVYETEVNCQAVVDYLIEQTMQGIFSALRFCFFKKWNQVQHIIPFTNGHTNHAKNVVSRNQMKVKVWHQKIVYIISTRQLQVKILSQVNA